MKGVRYIWLLICVLTAQALSVRADDYYEDDVYYWVAPIGATYSTAGADTYDETETLSDKGTESESQSDAESHTPRPQTKPQVVFLDKNVQPTDTVVRAIIRRSK